MNTEILSVGRRATGVAVEETEVQPLSLLSTFYYKLGGHFGSQPQQTSMPADPAFIGVHPWFEFAS
jgi:hypothetical protein